ncbi:MATE family efflux transporter [Bacillus licheniformis]|nr:MATE family efflux transporter [Bacillus licheniformis]
MTIILEPGRSFNVVIINSLRAAGDAKYPVYMAIVSMWGIGLPIAYISAFSSDSAWREFGFLHRRRMGQGNLMYRRWRSKCGFKRICSITCFQLKAGFSCYKT